MSETCVRDRILTVGRACFQRHPYDSVEMQDIAWAASVDAAEIQRHFASKEDLFSAVIEQCAVQVLEGWMGAEPLILLLRGLADPVCGQRVLAILRRTRLGSLGAHHLRAAALVLSGGMGRIAQ